MYLMDRVSRAEGILCERAIPLYNIHNIAGEDPEIALLGADAAVALACRLDLWHLELEDKGPAMAVASV